MQKTVEQRALWVIISPVITPAPGGGAVYYAALGKALTDCGNDVLVITEQFPGAPDEEVREGAAGSMKVLRHFPYRAGRSEKDLRSYASYLRQNMQFLDLADTISQAISGQHAQPLNILIHSSFFYKLNALRFVIENMKALGPAGAQLILDVRDPLFTPSHEKTFALFDAAIGCSAHIAKRLSESLPGAVTVREIPVPVEPLSRTDSDDLSKCIASLGLEGTRYVFNPNGVIRYKGFEHLLAAVRQLRAREETADIKLVTIGRQRDWSPLCDAAVEEGVLVYLGSVPHETSLQLMQNAWVTAVIGEQEGLPRSALESLGLGTPTLVPQLEEFKTTIPASVVVSYDPEPLAKQLAAVASGPTGAYPIERHYMQNLIDNYTEISNCSRS